MGVKPRALLLSLLVTGCSEQASTGGEDLAVAGEPDLAEMQMMTDFSVPEGDAAPPDLLSIDGAAHCMATSCDVHADCADSSGSIVCTCKPGYSGDGHSCTDVAVSLNGLRWDLPCTSPNANPQLCACTNTPIVKTATLAGAVGTTYTVTLRFRGIVEPNPYAGGAASGYFYTGGNAPDPYANVYQLSVSSPAQSFFLNNGAVRMPPDLYCDAMDYTRAVDVEGGATVTLTANPKDALQIKNRDIGGSAIVVPGVPPAPAAFDGQFVQMDVVSVIPK